MGKEPVKIPKFQELPEEVQKARVEKLKAMYDDVGIKTKTIPEMEGYFGKYNLIDYIDHPAFTNGSANIGRFDGITGKLHIFKAIAVLYGGLAYWECEQEYDVEAPNDDIVQQLYQMKRLVEHIKEEPIKKGT